MKNYRSIIANDTVVTFLIAITLITFAVTSRLVPHPANFAPIAAVAIFAGAILPRKWALSLPLIAMIASDLVIGLHSTVFFTWGSFLLIAFLSSKYLTRITPLRVMSSSLGASVVFYLISNFGVWLEGRMYPLTVSGLGQSYINAIPFFRNTIVGDIVFTSLLFGVYALITLYIMPRVLGRKLEVKAVSA